MVLAAAASFALSGILLLASLMASKSTARKLKKGAFLVAN